MCLSLPWRALNTAGFTIILYHQTEFLGILFSKYMTLLYKIDGLTLTLSLRKFLRLALIACFSKISIFSLSRL